MEALESAVLVMLEKDFDECPFKEEDPEDIEEQAEDVRDADIKMPTNDSGKLGSNVNNGTHGEGNNNRGGEPPSNKHQRVDTDNPEKPGEDETLTVQDEDGWPYIVAAHHLIPGNASLKKSMVYNHYMAKKGKGSKVLVNIGYDVNGSHNGVWLPGNYAIRPARLGPMGFGKKRWSKQVKSNPKWAYAYMLACCKRTHRQFHDTHKGYSAEVIKFLAKIAAAIKKHREVPCPVCGNQKKKQPPPYVIKKRLHGLSEFLRSRLTWPINENGRLPWITSDRFKDQLVKNYRLQSYDDD